MSTPHLNIISFDPGCPNWCPKGQWMTYVSTGGLASFIDGLVDQRLLRCLNLDIDPTWGGNSDHRIRFEMRAAYSICRADITRLLAYLSSRGRAITYKEGDHGYEIDQDGRILRMWELDDGAC